jgi:UDP-N-acetylmuramyl tripeptide synthase
MPLTDAEIDALPAIPAPAVPGVITGEARRLTGPGLLSDRPGAVVEIASPGQDPSDIARRWPDAARAVLKTLGWTGETALHRHWPGGITLFLSAPVDLLYTATVALQAAWSLTAARLTASPGPDAGTLAATLRGIAVREASPRLRALVAEAHTCGLDALLDDATLTLGHGARSLSFPLAALPDTAAIDWPALATLPVGLVTGTNGKTTTTRLTAAMARSAGRIAALTSTEAAIVGPDILDRGDWSGPSGARLVLRDPRTEIAVLEVARGGILRRGLPVRQARAAVVTNVAADHLGEYGILDVPALAEVKLSVRRGLGAGGILILNADDAPSRAESLRLGLTPSWFSTLEDAPEVRAAIAAGRPAAWVGAGHLRLFDGQVTQDILAVADAPLTMRGAARHNVENALAAILLASALGLPPEALRTALRTFGTRAEDNPGRANEYRVKGARVFVDFAHNPHSIAAITGALAANPARRRAVMVGHAGDRSDDDIRALARGAAVLGPDLAMIVEQEAYRRGRARGEISRLLAEGFAAAGIGPDRLAFAASPSGGAQRVIDWLEAGDLALLLVHSERAEIEAMLRQRG